MSVEFPYTYGNPYGNVSNIPYNNAYAQNIQLNEMLSKSNTCNKQTTSCSVIIISVILIIFVLIIIIVIWYYYYNNNSSSSCNQDCSSTTAKKVGEVCLVTSDCNSGLFCLGGKCTIPRYASCRLNPNGCVVGTQCIGGVCTPIPPNNVSAFISGNVSIQGNNNNTFVSLSIVASITETPQSVYNCPFMDAFIYKNVLYIISQDGTKIFAYKTAESFKSGTPDKIFNLNINIQGRVAIIGDKIYAIYNAYLHVSIIVDPCGCDGTFDFIATSIPALYVDSNVEGTQYYTNTNFQIFGGPAGTYVFLTADGFFHFNGVSSVPLGNNIGYPTFLSGSIQFHPHVIRRVSDNLFLIMSYH